MRGKERGECKSRDLSLDKMQLFLLVLGLGLHLEYCGCLRELSKLLFVV